MEPAKSQHIDEVFKLIKAFGKNTLGLELKLDGTEDDLEKIANELNILDKNISITRLDRDKHEDNNNFENDFVFKLLDAAPDGIVAINETGSIVLFNKQAEILFGYKRDEIIGEGLEILIPKQFRQPHKEHVAGYFKNPASRSMGGTNRELFGKRKNGEEFFVDISLSFLQTETGSIAICTIKDITEKNRLINEIARSEAKLKEITTAIPGIVYQYKYSSDGKMEFSFISEGSQSIWGMDIEDAYRDGSLPFNRIHPDDLPKTMAVIAESNVKGTDFIHSFRIVMDDGSIKWMQASGCPKKMEDGSILRSGCILDITQSKNAEKLLEDSEAFNLSLLASLTSEIAVIDDKGTVIATNKAWDDFSINNKGITLPLAKKGTNFFDLCKNASLNGDAIAGEALQSMQAVLNKEKQLIEFQYTCIENGTKKWFLLRIMTFRGNVTKIVLAHSNITEIKLAEQQVKESNDKYKTILETTDEMMNTVSSEGKIMWANNAWKKNLLYNDQDIIELRIIDVLSKETKERFEERFQLLKSGETLRNISSVMITKNGDLIEVIGTIVPLFQDNKFTGTQSFLRNVTEVYKERAERIKAETRLQRTLDNMVTGCMAIGFDWTYLYVNEAAAAHGLQTPGNILGKTMHEIYPGIENSEVFLKYKRCMEERIYLEFEEPFTFANGVTKWYDFQVEPIEEGIFVMSMDITQSKDAEENIRKNQDLLRESQRIAHLGSWELDLTNYALYWSDEVYRIFEIVPNLFGASYPAFLELVHPEDVDYVNKSYNDSVTNKTLYNIIHRIKFPDGRIKYLHEQAETFYDFAAIPIRTVGTVHDITQMKQAEILLQQNEHKFQQVVENISDGLMVRDVSGRIIFANKRFLELFGLEESDLSIINPGELIAPEHRSEMVDRHYRRFAGEDVPGFFEFLGLRKDGEKRWFETRLTKNTEDGEIVSVQSIVRDVTARKEAEQQLELQNIELKKINSELDRFVYSTSHDLRAPLMSMLGLIELCKDAADASELKQYFEMMENSISRIDETIKEIMDYSRNSRMELNIEQLDIKEIVNNQVKSIMHLSGARNIMFSMSFEEEIPFFSDKLRVTTIINNLVINAVKYQRNEEVQPFVRFSFKSTNEEGVITVEDNGEGISEDKQGKIFEMFYRNSEKSEGSGLGLYICNEIINKIGGIIKVKSEFGKGSTFTVHIPNRKPGN